MPRGQSRKSRETRRARVFSLVRIWAVTIAATLVVILGVTELVTSGRLRSFTARHRGPRDLAGVVADLDREIDGVLVKLGTSGMTSESEEHESEHYVWTHQKKTGRIPYGISTYECNLAITRRIRATGGRVIRAGEEGPDWQGLKTLTMRIGFGDIETHSLVLRESSRPEEDRELAAGAAPRIAIVIDDFGYSASDVATGILGLEFPVTISVLPHCPYTATIAAAAHHARKEVLVHIPMEPKGYPEVDPGEGALMTDHTREQLTRRINAALDDVPHAVGANNHMGSAFTSQHIPMRVLMRILSERGLYFLDSMTTPESVGAAEARRAGILTARNRMFIDSPLDESGRIDVESQLVDLVDLARQHGSAVGIGHPHPETLRVLERALPELAHEGVEFVFVSELLR